MKGPGRVAFALVLAVAIGLPVSGGCCDDFWGCAETVATAGLSCAAQAALASLRDLIKKIGDQRDSTTAEYEARMKAAIDETNGQLAVVDVEIKKLVESIDKACAAGDNIQHEGAEAIRAALIARQPLATAASPTPSGASRLKTTERIGDSTTAGGTAPSTASEFAGLSVSALQSLHSDPSLAALQRRLDDLKRRKEEIVAKIRKMEASAEGRMLGATQAAQDAYASQFLKPVDDFLAFLQQFLTDPLNLPALGNAELKLFGDTAIVEGLADRAENQIYQVGDDAFLTLHDPVEGLRKLAADAQHILDTMKKMATLETATERQTLAITDVAPPAPTPSQVRKIERSSRLAGRKKTLGAGFATLKPEALRLAQPHVTPNVAPFRQQLAGQFDGFYRGKSPADAKKKRDELVAEARRRFAFDPKTLAAVEKLLNDEARARGVPL